MKKLLAMTAIALAVTGCSNDTLPEKIGNAFGQLALSGVAQVGQTLTATVTDGNGLSDSAVSYSWMAGDTVIAGASSSSLTLTEDHAGSQISVTVSYTDNDAFNEVIKSNSTATVAMNLAGMLEISGLAESGKLLTATLTDGNGVAPDSVVYAWFADGVAIDGASAATYALTDNEVGKTITVSATYMDNDDFSEAVTSTETAAIAVASLNTPAMFSDLTATVANNAAAAAQGMVMISDDDVGENMVEAQTDVATMYGSFSIDASGAWSYTLDTANATIASLSGASDMVTDTVALKSVDGTMADFVITVTGVTAMATTQVAKITDNMTDDAGELRYKLDSAISAGKLTVSFYKDDKAETADGVAKDAYIGLYGESTSTSNAIVDLRIQADKFVIRNKDDIEVTVPFTPGKWTDVEMTWDASAASDSVAPLVTITIDGTSVTTDAFSSASSSLSDVMAGVRYAIFKLGDNSSTIPNAAFYVDNVKLFSDIAGTAVAFEDDFEGYTVGDSLDTDNDASQYHSNSAEVVVGLFEGTGNQGSGTGPGNAGNQVAKITDNMTDDAGELRYKLDSAIAQGKLTVAFLKEDMAVTADGTAKDAYIGLFGESTSTSNAIVDLRIQAAGFVIRDQDGIDVTVPFTPGKWQEVEMTWDASAASDSVAPLVTITIDGTSVTTEAFASASNSLSDVMTGVRYAIFKMGDNSSTIPSAAYFVDNVKIYSDMAGTTVAFEDDFEGYAEGASLDTDNEQSPYHSNTAEAVVAKE